MTYHHTKTTRAVLRSLVPVVCPDEAVPYGDAIVDHMALTFGTIPAILQRAIGVGFAAYDVGALPRYFKRARSLSPPQAEAYYQTWEHGFTPMHVQFAQMINQLMSMAAYEQPEMQERIGYRPAAWIKEVTHKRLTVFADDVKRVAERILAPDPLRPAIKAAKKEVA
jgi:hypothetical protein